MGAPVVSTTVPFSDACSCPSAQVPTPTIAKPAIKKSASHPPVFFGCVKERFIPRIIFFLTLTIFGGGFGPPSWVCFISILDCGNLPRFYGNRKRVTAPLFQRLP